MIAQKTIADSVTVEGVNVYTGRKSAAIFHPSKEGSGITFIVRGHRIPVALENAHHEYLCIALDNHRATAYLVEHMLSAIYAIGIDNLDVQLSGSVSPTTVNCAKDYFDALKPLIKEQSAQKRFWMYSKNTPETVRNGKGPDFIMVGPNQGFFMNCYSSYEEKGVAPQKFSFHITPEIFEDEIARARALRVWKSDLMKKATIITNKMGLHGVNDQTYQLLSAREIAENGLERLGLRYDGQETVRHKALDALGTLALTGRHFKNTEFYFHMTGHAFDLFALKKLFREGYFIDHNQ